MKTSDVPEAVASKTSEVPEAVASRPMKRVASDTLAAQVVKSAEGSQSNMTSTQSARHQNIVKNIIIDVDNPDQEERERELQVKRARMEALRWDFGKTFNLELSGNCLYVPSSTPHQSPEARD